jgi:hypothetical protein
MGSWLYGYITKNPSYGALGAVAALLALGDEGLEMDSMARGVVLDEEGHCEPFGRSYKLGSSPQDRASALLEGNNDISLTLRNSEIYFSCIFALKASMPHILIGWSARLFEDLSRVRKSRYLHLISVVAEKAGATSVVIVQEPLGHFEDNIIYIGDDLVVYDGSVGDQAGNVIEVWAEGGVVVEGLTLKTLDRLGIYSRNIRDTGGLL